MNDIGRVGFLSEVELPGGMVIWTVHRSKNETQARDSLPCRVLTTEDQERQVEAVAQGWMGGGTMTWEEAKADARLQLGYP